MANENAVKALVDQLAKTRDNQALADFTVTCCDRQWKVHRLVLALQSPVLARAVEGEFKEAKVRQIDLSDHDASSVGCLIHYVYNLDYQASWIEAFGDATLGFHVSMCVLADKYVMQPLKESAEVAFRGAVEQASDKELVEAAALVYDAPLATSNIRQVLVDHSVREKILTSKEPHEWTALGNYMATNAEFAKHYAHALELGSPGPCAHKIKLCEDDKRFQCPHCEHTMIVNIDPRSYGSRALFYCYWCGRPATVSDWQERVVEEE